MSEQRHVFQPGEVRYLWLDEDGQRTSMYHKMITSAYAYRKMLELHLAGNTVYSRVRGEYFRPQGTGKPAVRLVKVVMAIQQQEMDDDELALVEAAEKLRALKETRA